MEALEILQGHFDYGAKQYVGLAHILVELQEICKDAVSRVHLAGNDTIDAVWALCNSDETKQLVHWVTELRYERSSRDAKAQARKFLELARSGGQILLNYGFSGCLDKFREYTASLLKDPTEIWLLALHNYGRPIDYLYKLPFFASVSMALIRQSVEQLFDKMESSRPTNKIKFVMDSCIPKFSDVFLPANLIRREIITDCWLESVMLCQHVIDQAPKRTDLDSKQKKDTGTNAASGKAGDKKQVKLEIEHSQPLFMKQWSYIFGVSPNKMRELRESKRYHFRKVSPRKWTLPRNELPAEYLEKYRQAIPKSKPKTE